jgi:hypothetical protein
MRLTTPVSHFVVEKRLILRRDRAALELQHRLPYRGANHFLSYSSCIRRLQLLKITASLKLRVQFIFPDMPATPERKTYIDTTDTAKVIAVVANRWVP